MKLTIAVLTSLALSVPVPTTRFKKMKTEFVKHILNARAAIRARLRRTFEIRGLTLSTVKALCTGTVETVGTVHARRTV